MKERQIVMDLCTIFAQKAKIGCILNEKQMEMQTLNKKSGCHAGKGHLPGDGCGKCGKLSLACLQVLCRYYGSQCRHAGRCGAFLSDFITDIVVIVFVRISAKPEDEGHDYGHGKYETLATAIIGILLLFVGFGIFWNGASSIYRFLQGGSLQEPAMLALVAALVSIISRKCFINIPYSRAGS